jgi:O-antigen ligase
MPASAIAFVRAQWPTLIALGVLVLLPLGRSSEVPLAIGSVAGIVWVWRERARVLAQPGVRLATAVFACYWLAALLSAPMAVAAARSWTTVGTLLRFFPFALFACLALRDAALWPRLTSGIAAILVLWLLDAWVQLFTGYSIGGAMSSDRLSGIFGAGNLKLGPVLAVLAPFVFCAARARFGWRGVALAFAFQLMPILLAGSRAAWLMYALVSLAFVWKETRAPARFLAWTVAAGAVAVLAFGAAWYGSTSFDARVDRSLLALNGSVQALDTAAAGRLRIWSTAWRMSLAHPLLGVGVRGFRYAYPTYAQPGDAFVDSATEEGAAHAHQIVLEVLSETGAIGLLFWLGGAWFAISAWRRADPVARERTFAPALALAAMCFPLNTHLAFYSAWWGLLFWWLLSLYCAALHAEDAPRA